MCDFCFWLWSRGVKNLVRWIGVVRGVIKLGYWWRFWCGIGWKYVGEGLVCVWLVLFVYFLVKNFVLWFYIVSGVEGLWC